jgi:hypothetical protein
MLTLTRTFDPLLWKPLEIALMMAAEISWYR